MRKHLYPTTVPNDGESQVIEVDGTWMDGLKVDKILRDMDYHPFIGTRYILRKESGNIVGVIKQISSFWSVEVDEGYKDTEIIKKAIDKGLISILDPEYQECSSFEKYYKLLGIKIEADEPILHDISWKGISVSAVKKTEKLLFPHLGNYEI